MLLENSGGKLTEEEKQKVKVWLQQKWTLAAKCPICGSMNWIIGDHLVQPVTTDPNGGGVFLGGASYPQVMLISTECGYTHYFNAGIIGIVSSASQSDSVIEQKYAGVS